MFHLRLLMIQQINLHLLGCMFTCIHVSLKESLVVVQPTDDTLCITSFPLFSSTPCLFSFFPLSSCISLSLLRIIYFRLISPSSPLTSPCCLSLACHFFLPLPPLFLSVLKSPLILSPPPSPSVHDEYSGCGLSCPSSEHPWQITDQPKLACLWWTEFNCTYCMSTSVTSVHFSSR